MNKEEFDWTYFKRRIYIKGISIEELFQKWATPKGIVEWFIASARYEDETGRVRAPNEIVQAGDTYYWKFHVSSEFTGKVIEVIENILFKFTFGENDLGSNEQVIVTVTFHETDDAIWFDLLQENMSESKFGKVNYYISCNMGWVFHMNNLKSLIERGYDLRVTDEKRMHVDAPSRYPLEQFQWTQFRLNEYVKASKEEIFQKWATPKGITDWFIASARYEDETGRVRASDEIVQAGDSYIWTFFTGFTMIGKILEVKENTLFKFTFGKKEPDSDEDVIVTVIIHEQKNGLRIEIFQENIADNEYGQIHYNMSCQLGWSYFMTNLRSIYESGYDLREKEKDLAEKSRVYTLSR
ncbi:MAG: SRPBCC domain-containing protein [Candidatus Thorarchaeota archaeon]